ncbi:MAG: hypothetical protein HY886_08570 [Deltaproteobacteria bacterium]|nr:hypothetical protein [Deltaproteobacteria bacterium]
MRKRLGLTGLVLCALIFLFAVAGHAEEVYYSRCNLKILPKGNQITWMNWQSTPSFIPVGTKLKVTVDNDKAAFVDDKGTSYPVDLGASGQEFLEKFVTKHDIDVAKVGGKFAGDIKEAVIRVGMTREQAYMAMCMPAYINGKNSTEKTAYKEILAANQWVYERKRFAKRIGIEFDPGSGLVSRTEGIWKK